MDEVAEPGRGAEILAHHRAHHRKPHRGVQRGENPCERRRPVDMAQQLPLVHAQHARVGEHHLRHLAHALIDIEEDDEEHQRHAQPDLRPDAKPEPERENRRQHHARQRVHHLHIGVEHRGHERFAREPEPHHDTQARPDAEGEHRLDQRDPEMAVDRTIRKHLPDPRDDIERRREEEVRHQVERLAIAARADRHRGKDMPDAQRHHGDHHLKEQEFRPVHALASPPENP